VLQPPEYHFADPDILKMATQTIQTMHKPNKDPKILNTQMGLTLMGGTQFFLIDLFINYPKRLAYVALG